MATPLFMLFLMVAPYLIGLAASKWRKQPFDGRNAASLGLALLFSFTGLGHFVETGPMSEMLPSWVPERVLLVYLTGLFEFLIAAGFVFKRTRLISAWAAAAILVLFFPANVYAALNRVPMGGHAWGPVYLLIRGPVQVLMLAWVYWFCLRPPGPPPRRETASRPR